MASSSDSPLSWRTSVAVPPTKAADTTETTGAGRVAATQEEHFLCSSDTSRIQLDALHAAMASDLLWWAKPLARPQLAAMVNNSVCLGVYHLPNKGDDVGDMVGFARLITDRVTFAYLTDVYILPAYQRRGLGAWMMRCLRELFEGSGPQHERSTPASTGWPDLRSLWLVASTQSAARMYMGALGGEVAARYRPAPGVPDSGMLLIEMPGPANNIRNYASRKEAVPPTKE